MNNLNYIESKSKKDIENINGCINFGRKQTNEDGFNYNYFIYKPKKKTFVDTSTINIYLKCDEEILAVIPFNDYFDLKCNDSFEECKLVSKDSLFNFIKQNIRNSSGNIYLEYDYLCDNENIRSKQKKNISRSDLDTQKKIIITISCPVNNLDENYQTKCAAIFLDDSMKNNVDNSISLQKCNYPLFKTPYIVKDTKKYETIIENKKELEKKKVEKDIDDKMKELKQLKIEKYMKDNNISYKDAEKHINNIEKKNIRAAWLTFDNTDASSYFLNSKKYSDYITMYETDVKTLDDAKNIAELNNVFYFVWYHNNYNNKEYASKLFFISNIDSNKNKIDINIYDRKIFKKEQNITTCVYNNNVEGYDNVFDHITDLQLYTFDQVLDVITQSSMTAESLTTDANIIAENIEGKTNLNSVILNKIDNKIMTMQQKVKMSDYEESINNNILKVIYYILFFTIVISLIIIIYLNQKYPTVKLFGK
jgi:hypothetical protein